MISIVFGLATAVMFATSSLLNSRATRMISGWSIVAWAMLVGLIVTLPFLFVAGVPDNLTTANIAWLVVVGVGNVAGLVVSAYAYRVGKVAVIAPILATEGAIAAILAAILGQSIATIVAFLLLVIVVGVVIATIGPDPAPLEHERPVVAVGLAVVGAAVFGLSLFAIGHVSSQLPIAWALLPARLIGVVVLLVPLLVVRKLELTRRVAPYVVAMGFAEVIGFTCFSIGAEHDVAVTSVLASQFAPIAAIMAYFLFGERLGRIQIAGVAVIVVAVAALSAVS